MAADFIEIIKDVQLKYPEILANAAAALEYANNAATSEGNAADSSGAATVSKDAALVAQTAVEALALTVANDKDTVSALALAVAADATTASTKAGEASTSATTATQKAAAILALSLVAQTLIAGSTATASYDSVSGIMTLGIPKGDKGDKGDPFVINAQGLFSARATYDTQAAGFSFLATDLSLIYFREGATSGTWSAGATFGKGDTGADGDTVNMRLGTGNVIQWQHTLDGTTWYDLINLDTVYGAAFLPIDGKAADSSLLNGKAVVNSVISTDISAPVSAAALKSAYDLAASKLAATGKAADSALLNGKSVLNVTNSVDATAPVSAAALKQAYDLAASKLGESAKAADSAFLNGKSVLNVVNSTDTTAPVSAAALKSAYDLAASKLGATAKAVDSAALNGKTVINSVTSTDISAPAAAAAVKAAYDLAASKLSPAAAQALHATDALRISGNTIYLYKGNGTQENVSIPVTSFEAAKSFATNGYMKFTNGLIIQWGIDTNPLVSVTVTFPIAFPTACASVSLTLSGANNNVNTPIVNSKGLTSFAYYNQPYSLNVGWVAIGW